MIITIARQCGCGALHIGKLLSDKYGVPLFSRQNLLDMARDKGLEANMLDFFEERPADELQFSILLENSDIMARFREAFSSMIGQMDCIVVGRCGNVIFDHRSDLVSVFLKGDREQRIRNMAEVENISVREASELVRKMDDCRSSYHKYYTGHTWGAAQDYDLCVDSCRMGETGTADIISLYVEKSARL